jgi:protein YIPF1/2
MAHLREVEGDDLDEIPQTAGLLNSNGKLSRDNSNNKDKEEMPFCGCMSIRYYQPFFDIDTADITSRITQSVWYFQRQDNFLSNIGDKPDLYGPFWISTTLVFIVAFCSHMSAWLSSWMYDENWENDFQIIMNAASLIYGFVSLAPIVSYFTLGQLGVNVSLITLICLYGYSLFIFIIASLICLIPSTTATWLALLGAAGISSVFLMRNILPLVLAVSHDKVKTVTICLAVVQCIFAIILKKAIF